AVVKFFPEFAAVTSPGWDGITLRNLLTMSSGIKWNENLPWTDPRNDEPHLGKDADPILYVLSKPIAASPDTADAGERQSSLRLDPGGGTLLDLTVSLVDNASGGLRHCAASLARRGSRPARYAGWRRQRDRRCATRTGLLSSTQSSRLSGNSVDC